MESRRSRHSDTLQRYDQLLIGQPEQAPRRRVLRRMAEPNNPLQPGDWDAVKCLSDRIILHALYSDLRGLPPSFAEQLQEAARRGGYYLPHVILAFFWIQENGSVLALPEGFIDAVYRANAEIINSDPMKVSDLRLEVAAFLYLVGKCCR
jgi:hypothetical protein